MQTTGVFFDTNPIAHAKWANLARMVRFRRSKEVGSVRVPLSEGGVSASAGAKGLRLSAWSPRE